MKQKYLLDTCICAYWLRDKQNVKERINAVGFDNCYISEITIAELKFGKAYGQLKGGPKYREQPLKEFFEAMDVLPIAPVFDLYAEERARLTLAGTPTGDFDLLIGCTAVAEGMVMVTENVKDFQNIKGIQIENWIERNRQ
mgnify:FL=1